MNSELVSVESFDGAWLSGTLETPKKSIRAITITVHGSGCQDRDGNQDDSRHWIFPNPAPKRNLFIDFRNAVIDLGVGTFRYDKRASGRSEGVWVDTDLNALSKDLIKVHQWMSKFFPRTPIGFVGQSEGSLTILNALSMGASPDFLIFQGGVLESFWSILDDFQKDRAAKPFLECEAVSKSFPFVTAFYHSYYFGDFREQTLKPGKVGIIKAPTGESYRLNLDLYRQYEMDHLALLEEYKKPVLLVHGREDGNVSPKRIEHLMEKQRAEKRFSNVTACILEGLEHSFRQARPGESFAEAQSRSIDASYLETVREFLQAKVL